VDCFVVDYWNRRTVEEREERLDRYFRRRRCCNRPALLLEAPRISGVSFAIPLARRDALYSWLPGNRAMRVQRVLPLWLIRIADRGLGISAAW
jgi:hypothetical protein